MNGVDWLLKLAQHMAAEIVARTTETFWRRPDVETAARRFNSRIADFNSSMPDVLSKVLLAAYPDLKGRVITVDLGATSHLYPVVELIRGDSAGQEALTISPFVSDEHDSARHSEDFIAFLRKTGRRLWDNDVFRLVGISGRRILNLGITRYYKALTSCDRFLFDLVQHFPRKPTNFRYAMLARRSFLKKWRKDVENIVVHGKYNHLSAAVGVSVFTVMKRPSEKGKMDYWYPCVENSDEKSGARDRHVIPAFMYEPFTTPPQDKAKELDLEYQVLREFGEEIAGIPELRSMMNWEAVNATILRSPACNSLQSLLRNKRAVLRTTGLCLDLLRLRPEITCALIINDDKFYQDHVGEFKGSWESNPGVRWSRLTENADYEALLSDTDFPLCPPAVASIVSGRRFALKYLNLGNGQRMNRGRR